MGGVCTDACYNFVARCFRASSFLTGTCPSHFSRKRQWAMFIQTSSRVLVYSAGLSTLWYSMGFFLLGRSETVPEEMDMQTLFTPGHSAASLACPLVHLSGTIPPLSARDAYRSARGDSCTTRFGVSFPGDLHLLIMITPH